MKVERNGANRADSHFTSMGTREAIVYAEHAASTYGCKPTMDGIMDRFSGAYICLVAKIRTGIVFKFFCSS